MDKKIYQVTAYRYGDRAGHNYMVGIYGSFKKAKEIAIEEENNRAGKYSCIVTEYILDDESDNPNRFGRVVYRTELDLNMSEKTKELLKYEQKKMEILSRKIKFLAELIPAIKSVDIDIQDLFKNEETDMKSFRSHIIDTLSRLTQSEIRALQAEKNYKRIQLKELTEATEDNLKRLLEDRKKKEG
jgi:hypothetical protein